MAGKTYSHSDDCLNWLRGTTFPTITNPHFCGLLHTNPSNDDMTTGTAGVETVYTNYARQSIAATTSGYAAPAGSPTARNITNSALLTFPTAGATGDTGINGFFLAIHVATAISNAECYYWGTVTGAPKVINASDPVSIAIGALTITED